MGLSAEENGAIKFVSGKQYTFIFGKKIQIPSFMRGNIELLERFNDEQQKFYLDLKVTTKLLDPLLGFRRWFTGEYLEFKNKKIPEKFKPIYLKRKQNNIRRQGFQGNKKYLSQKYEFKISVTVLFLQLFYKKGT